ncbi:endonuclease/exonuclease/phosphatase family protein [Streptomyces gilvus]|uniref:endonuclease/exonuclease/phosphatase family protein n=1 Tax=Streptomyces gilvus TaxID=2920937 RepID=UPI001F10375A|nr:endonuclease/exonuclease/phosphatase family protein [Streptomyces sp. CME 23]MCH5675789.1 endonuclease/exonuclease/phosphatase family protein [Streptomyces sp. CME 23]
MRIATWNLWWRFGPWAERQKAVLAVLHDLRPDVVGLQEVWAEGDDNLAGWLADELDMHWTWAPSPASDRWQRRIGRTGVEIGNAVLSRWPLVERDVLHLPAPEDVDDGRIALYARVAAPGHQVPFFSAHLTSHHTASAIRCRQVTALAGFVAAHRGRTDFPPVVTGDFNAGPDSDEIRLFRGADTFSDAWDQADPSAPSATLDHANPYNGPSHGPGARVDYIHIGTDASGLGTVRRAWRAGDGPVDGVWPSDHAAVAADLRVW